jgi:hypothetical protein
MLRNGAPRSRRLLAPVEYGGLNGACPRVRTARGAHTHLLTQASPACVTSRCSVPFVRLELHREQALGPRGEQGKCVVFRLSRKTISELPREGTSAVSHFGDVSPDKNGRTNCCTSRGTPKLAEASLACYKIANPSLEIFKLGFAEGPLCSSSGWAPCSCVDRRHGHCTCCEA